MNKKYVVSKLLLLYSQTKGGVLYSGHQAKPSDELLVGIDFIDVVVRAFGGKPQVFLFAARPVRNESKGDAGFFLLAESFFAAIQWELLSGEHLLRIFCSFLQDNLDNGLKEDVARTNAEKGARRLYDRLQAGTGPWYPSD